MGTRQTASGPIEAGTSRSASGDVGGSVLSWRRLPPEIVLQWLATGVALALALAERRWPSDQPVFLPPVRQLLLTTATWAGLSLVGVSLMFLVLPDRRGVARLPRASAAIAGVAALLAVMAFAWPHPEIYDSETDYVPPPLAFLQPSEEEQDAAAVSRFIRLTKEDIAIRPPHTFAGFEPAMVVDAFARRGVLLNVDGNSSQDTILLYALEAGYLSILVAVSATADVAATYSFRDERARCSGSRSVRRSNVIAAVFNCSDRSAASVARDVRVVQEVLRKL